VSHHQQVLRFEPGRPGLHEITRDVVGVVEQSGVQTGLCSIFVQHTSASLLIQENADPSARHDLEVYFATLAPEGSPAYTHTAEGADDMPAHLRAALTHTSELIPVVAGRLGLGTWQGLYLFEHRRRPGSRRVIVHVWGES
jgi:secondary thiamine-phosphate synthase enzyme